MRGVSNTISNKVRPPYLAECARKHARRIARKVQGKLPDHVDAAAQLAVKEIEKAFAKDKGFAGDAPWDPSARPRGTPA